MLIKQETLLLTRNLHMLIKQKTLLLTRNLHMLIKQKTLLLTRNLHMLIKQKTLLLTRNLHMLIKQKTLLLTRNLAPRTFGELFKVFQTKTNLLYLLYSTAPRCCLLHLIKRNCVLKNFLRTLIIITQVIIITRVLPSI